MINKVIRFIVIIIILVLLQVLVFNYVQFSGFVNPYVYIMIILLLPFTIPSWLLLIVAFFGGLLIDLFSGTPGMHASATLIAGFLRPYVLKVISPHDGYESGSDLSMAAYGFRWFLLYASVIVVIHHTALFYLEVFRLADFFRTLLRVIVSSIFTIGIILLIEYYRKGR